MGNVAGEQGLALKQHSDVDLVAGTTFDNVYHVLASTGVLSIDVDVELLLSWNPGNERAIAAN